MDCIVILKIVDLFLRGDSQLRRRAFAATFSIRTISTYVENYCQKYFAISPETQNSINFASHKNPVECTLTTLKIRHIVTCCKNEILVREVWWTHIKEQ